MKKNAKKLCSFLMSIVLVVSLLSGAALAVDDEDFAPDTVAVIDVGGQVSEYTSLSAAIDVAKQLGLTVYLVANHALPTDLEIPSNVTVVIPTSSNYTADINPKGGANVGNSNAPAGSAYVTLTVPSGTKLTVDGTLIVAGNQQATNPRTGFLTGAYGAVDVEGEIVVNNILYARGEIYTNAEGKVTVKSTATVYQRFEIADWRGGTASSFAYAFYRVFPFNLYGLGGISAETTYYSGAKLYGQAYIYASNQDVNVNVPFLITSGEGLIRFADEDGTVQFSKKNEGKTTVTVNANVETGHLSFNEDVDGETYPITSKGTVCPIGYNLDFVFTGGSTATILSALKVLPGCDITFEDNSTLVLGGVDAAGEAASGEVYFYTIDQYSNTYNWIKWPSDTDNVSSATLDVTNGTVKVTNGFIASSADNFNNIHGLGTLTDGGTANIVEVTQNGSSVSPHNVTFYKAVLPTTPDPDPAE